MALKALVTGGTGFVGQHLVRRLLADGWDVRAFVLSSEKDRLPSHANLEIAVGDITKPETLRGTMDDVDSVFHLAALVDAWVRDPQEYVRVNVEGTDHVIREALASQVGRFLFTSSMCGIGVRRYEVMREDSPPGRVFGPYEASKADAQRRVEAAVRDHGLPAVVLIPGIVIGPGDTRNTGRFLLSYVRGEFPGTFAEDSVLPVVGVEDVARAHVLAYHRAKVGSRYLISAENLGWGDLLRIASLASGTPIPSRHIGGRALWLASRTGELFALVTRAPPRLPSWLADFMLTGASMDNRKSIQELGMRYRPVEESIRAAIDWFGEEGLFEKPVVVPHHLIRMPAENPPGFPETSLEPMAGEVPPTGAVQERRPKPPEGPA